MPIEVYIFETIRNNVGVKDFVNIAQQNGSVKERRKNNRITHPGSYPRLFRFTLGRQNKKFNGEYAMPDGGNFKIERL